MAAAEEYAAWIVANQDKRGTPEFKIVSDAYQHAKGIQSITVRPQTGNETIPQTWDGTEYGSPADGMSGPAKFAAGAKAKLKDLALGAGQLAMLPVQDAIEEKARIDKPLMETSAGKAGAVGGALLPALLAAPIPGANTYTGSALIGGALGLLEPVQGQDILSGKLQNAGLGAAAGLGGQATGNILAAGLKGIAGLVKPLFASGQDEIANAIIQQAAHDPAGAARAAAAYMPATAGVVPTLAESTMDPGISALQRAATGTDVPSRHLANRGALVDALKNIAGTDAQKKVALAARDSAASRLYAASDSAMVPTDAEFKAIFDRPEVKSAWSRIVENAKNRGELPPSMGYTPASRTMSGLSGWKDIPESFGEISGKDLHSLKMALDDSLIPNPSRGIGKQDAKANKAARDSVVAWIESRIPEYGQARTTFRDLSKPIGQMDVAQALHDRLVPALSEAAGSNSRLAPSAYARAIRDQSERLAQSATDFPIGGIEDVLTPAQMRTVQGISSDLGREQAAYDAAMTRGSPTSRNLVTQNLIDQISGSLGGGRAVQALVRAMTRIPSRAIDVGYAGVSDDINAAIARKLANSQLGLSALQATPNAGVTDQFANALSRLGAPAALGIYGGQ